MKRPVHIAYVSPVSVLFGAERSMLDTICSLDRTRFTPHLITLEAGPLEEAARREGIAVTRLPWLRQPRSSRFDRRVVALVQFSRWLRQSHTEILVLNLFSAGLPIDIGLLVMASKLAGAKFVLRHRISTTWWLSFYEKFWLARADRIISVTRAAIAPWLRPRRSDVWSPIRQERIRIIPSSRNVEELNHTPADRTLVRQLGVPDGARLVGMVARLHPLKRPDLFLRAAAIIHHQHPSVWFMLVGGPYGQGAADQDSSYEQSLKLLAAEGGVAQRVIFTGYRNDAIRLIQNFDVCVLPSEQEALGGVLIEAMACGVPVVASRVGGLPEIIKDGETGLLIASDDPQDYVTAILGLLNDRAQARRMGDFGKEWAKRFDSAHTTRLVESCFDELTR